MHVWLILLCVWLQACDVSQNFRAVMLAIAMQESPHMDVALRDADKDFRADGSRSPAANATLFNLNVVSCPPRGPPAQADLFYLVLFFWGQCPVLA